MKNLTLTNIANACGGELKNYNGQSAEASCVVIDSRKLEAGGIFIATRGERVDGHDFIKSVSESGALGIVCEKEPTECDAPYIIVKDSFKALKDIAAFYRQQLSVKLIGITGSVGKTSTKELIAAVLSVKYSVYKTQGNFNNEVGVPLTLLSIRDNHELAVVEMGISDFGEMTRLTEIAKPDTCVITNIGECHLEALGDRDGVLRAKTEIFKGLNKDGAVILNGDDDKLRTVKAPFNRKPLFFGFNKDNDIYAKDIESLGLLGSRASLVINDKSVIKVKIPLPGEHMIYNAMAATLVGLEYGMSTDEIKEGIASVKATSGRSNIIKTKRYVIIDDCYNANPVSVRAAIALLKTADTRKVAILGDMLELGENEDTLHKGIGEYAAENDIDVIITIGKLSENIYESAKNKRGSEEGLYHFESLQKAYEKLLYILKDGDSILIKASHSMNFEDMVTVVKAFGGRK